MNKYLEEVIEKDGVRIFSGMPNDRTRVNGANEIQEIHLNIRKAIISVRVVKHWHRFPREVVDFPSLEIFKDQ